MIAICMSIGNCSYGFPTRIVSTDIPDIFIFDLQNDNALITLKGHNGGIISTSMDCNNEYVFRLLDGCRIDF